MEPTLNIDLLDKTLSHIETLHAFQNEGVHLDDQWRQSRWAVRTECGTNCCFAGWAVLLTGHQLVDDPEYAEAIAEYGGGVDEFDLVVDAGDGKTRRIPVVAREELGLRVEEGHELFWGSNTVAALRRQVERIKAARAAEA